MTDQREERGRPRVMSMAVLDPDLARMLPSWSRVCLMLRSKMDQIQEDDGCRADLCSWKFLMILFQVPVS